MRNRSVSLPFPGNAAILAAIPTGGMSAPQGGVNGYVYAVFVVKSVQQEN